MNWIKRVLAPALAATLGVAGLALACPASAGATTTPTANCKTVTTDLANRPDHGHGTPGVWALDTIIRTVKVCVEPAPQAEKVAIDTWTYTATLVDVGTFLTQAGPTNSPNNGVSLTGGVPGALYGQATFAKFTAPHDWGYWDPSAVDGKSFNGTAPSSTGDWIKLFWKDGFSGTSITSYAWVYQTCVAKVAKTGWLEQWVDSSAKDNDDGQSASAGDITGKRCPSKSPSPKVSASTVVPPTGGATGTPSLPVTGSNVPLLVAGGVGSLMVGIVVVVFALRRRRRVEFTA